MKKKSVKDKKNPKLEQLKYALLFFAFVVLYNFLVVNKCKLWSIDYITYAYHLVDYSFGFATRLLPGALYHLFFKEVWGTQVTVFETVVLLLVFAAVAALLAKLITVQTDKATKNSLLLLSLFFLSGPCTFAVFSFELGILDVYWLVFSVLFLLLCANRYLKFSVPVLFVLSVFVHYSCMIAFFLLFSIVLLFRIMKSEGKEKRQLQILLGIGLVLSVGLSAYFVLFEKSNLVYTMEQFNRQLAQRNHYHDVAYTTYYDYTFYNYYENDEISLSNITAQPLIAAESGVFGLLGRAVNPVYFQLRFIIAFYRKFPYYIWQMLFLVLLLLPLYAVFVTYWRQKMKGATRKREKALYLMCALQMPLTIVLGFIFSIDASRWFSNALIIQFTLVFYCIYLNKDTIHILERFSTKYGKCCILIYYIVYALCFVNPYQ